MYGCPAAPNTASTGPSSTTRPAYITTTRSASPATTPRSWVTITNASPISRCRSTSSSRIWAWVVTSSAVVGSSAISTRGRLANAIAIITRWRMPPDSSCGYARARAGAGLSPTRSSISTARPRAARREPLASCTAIASATWSPTRWTGFSAVIGSWNTMAISRPRTSR